LSNYIELGPEHYGEVKEIMIVIVCE